MQATGLVRTGIPLSYSEIYNTGTLQGSNGILFAYGDGNQAYGNIIRNNKSGIGIAYGASNTQVYNNTIYGNTYNGISNGAGWASKPNSNTVIKTILLPITGDMEFQIPLRERRRANR